MVHMEVEDECSRKSDGQYEASQPNPKEKGLTAGGDVQRFHTNNVLRRIVKYMPYRSGATIKLTQAQTDINKPEIVTDTP
jgi:hypothetical protein